MKGNTYIFDSHILLWFERLSRPGVGVGWGFGGGVCYSIRRHCTILETNSTCYGYVLCAKYVNARNMFWVIKGLYLEQEL